jgi:hypothetical protein
MTLAKLDCKNADGQIVESVQASFDDADIQRLRQFLCAMERVRGTALLKRGLPFLTNMRFTEQGMQMTCPPCSDAELYELLHVLRPVILHREISSFNQIGALIKQRFASRGVSDYLKNLRTIFDHGELAGYMQLYLNGESVLHKSLLDVWLNGTQYHTDQEKAEQWHHLQKGLREENARALVITQIHSRVKALFLLADLVHLIVKRAPPVV